MANRHGDRDPAARDPAPRRPNDAAEQDDVTGRKDPPSPREAEREVNTPGDGAGPDISPDGEADPGVG